MLWPFEYHAPDSSAGISQALTELHNVELMAGGTDLLVEMRAGMRRPDHVVDLKRVQELRELRAAPGDTSFIGAAVDLNRIIEEPALPWHGLRQAASSIATYQIRNRATAVGNLCHASPAADISLPLLVLDAQVLISGAGDDERVPLSAFFSGVKTTVMRPGQWVKGIEIPPQPPELRSVFMKKTRIRGHDLAGVNLGGAYDPDTGRLVLAVGACAPTPLLFDLSRLWSEAKSLTAFIAPAVETVVTGLLAICDTRASYQYRHAMVELFCERALRALLRDGE